MYRAFDCGAIVHTHSEYATMFAQARTPIRCMGTTHADYFRGDIPVTRPMRREEVEQRLREEHRARDRRDVPLRGVSPDDVQAVLVANHGPFAWGADASKAIENARVLEYLARLEWRVRTHGAGCRRRRRRSSSTSTTFASTARRRTTGRSE